MHDCATWDIWIAFKARNEDIAIIRIYIVYNIYILSNNIFFGCMLLNKILINESINYNISVSLDK